MSKNNNINKKLPKRKESPKVVKVLLISTSILFIFTMLIIPMATLVSYALKDGFKKYQEAVMDTYTIKALWLTITATVASVMVNTVFGLFAAWTITKFKFRGKHVLNTLIDLPFAISPVIAGLIFVLTFGRIGWAYDFINALNIKIVFAVPGIILATIFVTFPFISRELIPVLNSNGKDEEEAAALMGAGAWTIFWKVTFPHIKWGFLYGVVLCTARAMGEFGAVSVISGHLRGKTNTLPLHVEIIYNEFKLTDAFAVSSILVIMAVIILILRNILEYKSKRAGMN